MELSHHGEILHSTWYSRDAQVVAPELLNKLIVSRAPDGTVVTGRIVEVEAYREDDPASHTYRGRTPRNEVMFGPAGRLYVYLSYGIHVCANVVTGADGEAQALLLRALIPVGGIDTMRSRRGGQPDRNLVNGPGKLCEALGVSLEQYGTDLSKPSSPLTIVDDGVEPPTTPLVGPRVGITRGVETPWRFRVGVGVGGGC